MPITITYSSAPQFRTQLSNRTDASGEGGNVNIGQQETRLREAKADVKSRVRVAARLHAILSVASHSRQNYYRII